MSHESTVGEKALFLLLGTAIGAAAALLFAPRSGEETRKLIATKARESADLIATKARESADLIANRTKVVAGKTSEYVERGKEILQQQRDQLSAASDAFKQVYREEKNKV
jgi:gas vesicle protein